MSLPRQMYVTCTVQAKGTRLAKPVLSLGLMCLAFLTGLNRVAEYRNHWSDVIAGFIIGTAIATFLVRLTPTEVIYVVVCLRCVIGDMVTCMELTTCTLYTYRHKLILLQIPSCPFRLLIGVQKCIHLRINNFLSSVFMTHTW